MKNLIIRLFVLLGLSTITLYAQQDTVIIDNDPCNS
jgi:hypothetical protein